MFDLDTKYGIAKIYAETIEDEAVGQITKMANSPLGENAHIRIMPDAHAGAGCTIGTTMLITNKVCPNLVGVDIGCGVRLEHLDIDLKDKLDVLDAAIRRKVPFGMNVHDREVISEGFFSRMKCWDKLKKDSQNLALHSLGTLGGGNHFIEAYEDGYISVHSGSRNIGYKVAQYYQNLAEKRFNEIRKLDYLKTLDEIPPKERQGYIAAYKPVFVEKDLMWLYGEDMADYLYDVQIMQEFAEYNRFTMVDRIAKELGCHRVGSIESVHNYIDTDTKILRKGAIAADKGKLLVIPLNMRDGILICTGKGNEDWNYSAPHGAGRLYSRSKAKELFQLDQYQKSMEGIYTTCVNNSTIDEAPFVYKDWKEIEQAIQPTVTIEDHILPIYNFKAN